MKYKTVVLSAKCRLCSYDTDGDFIKSGEILESSQNLHGQDGQDPL